MARAGGPHYDNEDIERARRSIGRSACVTLADDPNTDLAYLSFILEPDHEKIFIDYESGRHEEASRELRERLECESSTMKWSLSDRCRLRSITVGRGTDAARRLGVDAGVRSVALLFGDGVRFIRQFGKPPGAAE